MTDASKTATPKQGTLIIGGVALFGLLLAFTVMPTLKPRQSKLVGLPAAEFSLPVITGGSPGSRVSLSDLRGKVVVIDFWASWCAPCRAEAPLIDRLAREYDGKGLVVLGIATSGDDPAHAMDFATSQNLSYTTLFDEGDRVGSAFHVVELPTLVVVGRDGTVKTVRSRMIREDELKGIVTAALRTGA